MEHLLANRKKLSYAKLSAFFLLINVLGLLSCSVLSAKNRLSVSNSEKDQITIIDILINDFRSTLKQLTDLSFHNTQHYKDVDGLSGRQHLNEFKIIYKNFELHLEVNYSKKVFKEALAEAIAWNKQEHHFFTDYRQKVSLKRKFKG